MSNSAGLGTRRMLEFAPAHTPGAMFAKAFCWSCSKKTLSKGGSLKTAGNLRRFTCAACITAKNEKAA